MRVRRHVRTAAWLIAAGAAVVCGGGIAHAELIELKDGSSVDGKVLRENEFFIWVKTLEGVQKLNLGDVTTRTESESPFEQYEALVKATKADSKSADAYWALHQFLVEHAGLDKKLIKERGKALAKVIKLAPDHAEARDANGEVQFEGAWVKKTDLDRLQRAAEGRRIRKEWMEKLNTPVDVYPTDHFLLLDGGGDKDLAGRAEAMEEAYSLLCEVLDLEQLWNGRSITVTMADRGDYLKALEYFVSTKSMSENWMKDAKHEQVSGMWRVSPNATHFRHPQNGVEGMWHALVHGTSHLAIWTLWRNQIPPTWLEEGLGCWVELEVLGENIGNCVRHGKQKTGRDTSDKGAGKGDKNKGDAGDDEKKEACIDAVADGSFPPMRKFLNMRLPDYGLMHEGGALGLVTWLMGKDEEKFPELVLRLRAGGARADDPWTDTYGYELIEEMEKEWKAWVLSEW